MMMAKYGESEVRELCEALFNKKAFDICAIHVADKTIVADWFIIASGHVSIQVKALCDELEEKAKELGMQLLRKEGYEYGRWIVLDYGSVLVHLFHPEEREFYKLERLWQDSDNTIVYPE